jgi:hypothetical protein
LDGVGLAETLTYLTSIASSYPTTGQLTGIECRNLLSRQRRVRYNGDCVGILATRIWAKHRARAAGRKDFQVHDYSNDTRGADAAINSDADHIVYEVHNVATSATPAASAPAARAEAPAADPRELPRKLHPSAPPAAR